VTAVEAETPEGRQHFAADLVVVACGAINSALLLLRSANDRHPDGLANRSGLVGRNYMAHNAGAVLVVSGERNRMVFQKTLAVTDFYWGDKIFDFPLGSVQAVGRLKAEKMARHGPPVPGFFLKAIERRSMAWFLINEDLPDPANRVIAQGDRVALHYRRNNLAAYRELKRRWIGVLKAVHRRGRVMPMLWCPHAEVGLEVAHHQCGTCRFGEDPASSVLDVHCRTHDIDNLYVVDGSFFPSSAALNPALTIMANAVRVGDHLVARMK
jgi:choline dehydrogenase-like flavoprotein